MVGMELEIMEYFGAADCPDPRPPHPKQYPIGTDPELEQMLHKLIAKAKTSGAGRMVGV